MSGIGDVNQSVNFFTDLNRLGMRALGSGHSKSLAQTGKWSLAFLAVSEMEADTETKSGECKMWSYRRLTTPNTGSVQNQVGELSLTHLARALCNPPPALERSQQTASPVVPSLKSPATMVGNCFLNSEKKCSIYTGKKKEKKKPENSSLGTAPQLTAYNITNGLPSS